MSAHGGARMVAAAARALTVGRASAPRKARAGATCVAC